MIGTKPGAVVVLMGKGYTGTRTHFCFKKQKKKVLK